MDWTKIKYFFRLIRVEHTLFMLPFVYIGAFMAANNIPDTKLLILITLALLTGRVIAMTGNRVLDAEFDKKNARTMHWPIASGKITKKEGYIIISVFTLMFFLIVYMINFTAFILSFVTIPVFLIYSLLKRYTWLSHVGLGIVEGIVPVGGWIAVTGNVYTLLSLPIVLMFLIAVLWLTGFDILYAIQDVSFDRKENLKSIPARFGVEKSIYISFFVHIAMGVLISYLYFVYPNYLMLISIVLIWALILTEHLIVGKNHLERINIAFFHVNVTIGFVLLIGIVGSVLINIHAL
ncbi:MAG: 4-hydroxybenzoate octaprenyltransferase [Thermoplasmata archaeon]